MRARLVACATLATALRCPILRVGRPLMPLDNIGAALADVFTDGFALLAMPLFILAGELMNRSGVTRALTRSLAPQGDISKEPV